MLENPYKKKDHRKLESIVFFHFHIDSVENIYKRLPYLCLVYYVYDVYDHWTYAGSASASYSSPIQIIQ